MNLLKFDFNRQTMLDQMPTFFSLLRIAVFVYLGLGLMLVLSERRIVYLPDFPEPRRFEECGAFAGAEKVTYRGARFHYKNIGDAIAVMYHGNAGSACDRAAFADIFDRAGYSYLFAEYPGYAGDPTDKPSKKRVLENVQLLHEFLEEKNHQSVALVGESLGVGVAAYHASISQPNKVIFISPHYELADLAGWYQFVYPVRLLMRENYTPGLWMKDVEAPTLFIRAAEDEFVPRWSVDKLKDSVGGEVTLVEIPGTHNEIYINPKLYESIESFLLKQ